jgi:hypothetical protein
MTGCLFQIEEICNNYFSYETNTLVIYEDEDKISLPAITVCIEKNFLIRDNFLFNSSAREESLNYSAIDGYLNTLTVKEQFHAIYLAEEVFSNSCVVMKPIAFNDSDFRLNCELISPIRQSIDYYQSCFTFFSQINNKNNDKYSIDYDLSVKNYYSEMVRFKMFLNIPKIQLYLHSKHELLTDSLDNSRVKMVFNNITSFIKYHLT